MKDLISRQRVLKLLSTMPPEEATTKALLIQSVKQMDAPDNLVKDSQGLAKDLVNDCISRQAAIDAVHEEFDDCLVWDESGKRTADEFEIIINRLPSAQPEQNGKWIYNSPTTMKCDRCGFAIKDWDWHRFKYCPNCRADMRGEQE